MASSSALFNQNTSQLQSEYAQIVPRTFFIWVGDDISPGAAYTILKYQQFTQGNVELLVSSTNINSPIIKFCESKGITLIEIEKALPAIIEKLQKDGTLSCDDAKLLNDSLQLANNVYKNCSREERFAVVSDIVRIIYLIVSLTKLLYSDVDVIYKELSASIIKQLKDIKTFACILSTQNGDKVVGNAKLYLHDIDFNGDDKKLLFHILREGILPRAYSIMQMLNTKDGWVATGIKDFVITTTGPVQLSSHAAQLFGRRSFDGYPQKTMAFTYGVHLSAKMWLATNSEWDGFETYLQLQIAKEFPDSVLQNNEHIDSRYEPEINAYFIDWYNMMEHRQNHNPIVVAHNNKIASNDRVSSGSNVCGQYKFSI